MIRWKRPDDGIHESHCGRFTIEPLYNGSMRPYAYWLHDTETRARTRSGAYYAYSVRDAKATAERIATNEIAKAKND